MNQTQFARRVLGRLGIKPTAANLKMMRGWMAAEGGHWNNDARHNPLNTTQPMPGAGNTGSQGNIKQFTSWEQGVDATVKTIRNGRYGDIIQSLKGKDTGQFVSALGRSPWGTDASLVAKTVGAPPSDAPAAAVRPSSTSRGRVSASVRPIESARVDRRRIMRQTIAQGVLSGQGLLASVMQAQQATAEALELAPKAPQPSASAPTTTPKTGTKGSPSAIKELFYDPIGGFKHGQQIGAIGGHGDHVHVAADPKRQKWLQQKARSMGLQITSTTGGKHAEGSYHYSDQAFDAAGTPERMKAFAELVRRKYKLK